MREDTCWEGKYKIIVKDAQTKKIIKEEIKFNRILDSALIEMGKALYDGNNDCIVNYLGLGTSTATLLNTLTSLGSETFRTYRIDSTVSGTGEVKNIFSILANEAKFHIKEVGIFMGSTATIDIGTGRLLSIISWDFNKTDLNVDVDIIRYDSFNRSTKDRSVT